MKSTSLLTEFAGDPAMSDVREHAGWKPVLVTLLALVFCVTVFFNAPAPQPAQVAAQSAAQTEPVTPTP